MLVLSDSVFSSRGGTLLIGTSADTTCSGSVPGRCQYGLADCSGIPTNVSKKPSPKAFTVTSSDSDQVTDHYIADRHPLNQLLS